jgi:hypothetical protein
VRGVGRGGVAARGGRVVSESEMQLVPFMQRIVSPVVYNRKVL